MIKKLEEKVEEYESRKNMLLSNVGLSKNNISAKSIDMSFSVLEHPYDIRKTGNVDPKRPFLQLVFRNNLLINKKKEGFGTLPLSSFYLLNHQFSDVSVLVGGPTAKISEPILAKYDEIIDEIHRFANFGLFLAK